MPEEQDYFALPRDLPAPEDDGACDHLPGTRVPGLGLPATNGLETNLASFAGRTVVYCYPMTGRPGEALPDGWDETPGARGCTPQSCAFRDHHTELRKLGARVFGLSTQSTGYQREAAERLRLPFPLLSDAGLRFARAGAADLRGREDDPDPAPHPRHPKRAHREGLLPRLPAGRERRRGSGVTEARKSRPAYGHVRIGAP